MGVHLGSWRQPRTWPFPGKITSFSVLSCSFLPGPSYARQTSLTSLTQGRAGPWLTWGRDQPGTPRPEHQEQDNSAPPGRDGQIWPLGCRSQDTGNGAFLRHFCGITWGAGADSQDATSVCSTAAQAAPEHRRTVAPCGTHAETCWLSPVCPRDESPSARDDAQRQATDGEVKVWRAAGNCSHSSAWIHPLNPSNNPLWLALGLPPLYRQGN